MKNRDAADALKNCESNFMAADTAMKFYLKHSKIDRSLLLGQPFRERDLLISISDLEQTFIVYLFSVFEFVLRDYWKNGLHKSTCPAMKPLIASLFMNRRMDPIVYGNADKVRDYRNLIVHAGRLNQVMSFRQCCRYLGSYVACLPLEW
jgi:hypothetical protein